MESIYLINLILIFVLNICFFFSGVRLNSVVIISFWRSAQLRKRLCYFMIMVLSSFDLLALFTNSPTLSVVSMLWMTEVLDINSTRPHVALKVTNIFLAFSLFALLVMNFDRYLATSYPIFHRTSVTKGRLLTLLAILIFIEVTLAMTSLSDQFIRFHQLLVLIIFILLTPPTIFINFKLFLIIRSRQRINRITPEIKKHSLQKIFPVACWH